MLLSKDQILKADDRPTEEVEVPEWGGSVLVRGMDGDGRDEFFASMTVQRGKKQVMDVASATAKLVARCIVDPDDREQLMFSAHDVAALGKKSAAALERVGAVAQRLSGLTDEDMEELGKASAPTPSEGSISSSPAISEPRSKPS